MIKLLESHHIKKYDSGIVKLVLNVVVKGISVHAYNNKEFELANYHDDYIADESLPAEEIFKTDEIESLLDKDKMYRRFDTMNKTQYECIWVPLDLMPSKVYLYWKSKRNNF